MLAYQPLFLREASELPLAISAATDLPLTLQGAYSQLQVLLLFSETPQRTVVKDIIHISPNTFAFVEPLSA